MLIVFVYKKQQIEIVRLPDKKMYLFNQSGQQNVNFCELIFPKKVSQVTAAWCLYMPTFAHLFWCF